MLCLLPLLLAGCAVFPSSKNYTPVVARYVNMKQYQADLEECHWTADNYLPGTDVGTIAQQTFSGATNNTATAVINPLVPLAGAAGGAAGAVISAYDLTGQDSIKILVRCLAKETAEDGSAVIADPHE
jgi:hypothetical protein